MEATRDQRTVVARELPAASRRAPYRIVARGVTSAACRGWAGVIAAESEEGATAIAAAVDQAGLRGILCRLWDLNATLVAAVWTPEVSGAEGEEEDD